MPQLWRYGLPGTAPAASRSLLECESFLRPEADYQIPCQHQPALTNRYFSTGCDYIEENGTIGEEVNRVDREEQYERKLE
jgi:hypothetical protein